MASQEILNSKIQELQAFERTSQTYAIEKQNFQIELNGVDNALDELKVVKDEVYKIVGGLMVRSDKKVLVNELEEKKKMLDLRIKNIEKQEKIIDDKVDALKKEVNSSLSNKE